MRVPRVQFRVRRLMALVTGVAFLMPIGMWVRDMWWRRVYLLDGAAIVAVNERTANPKSTIFPLSFPLTSWQARPNAARRRRPPSETTWRRRPRSCPPGKATCLMRWRR